MALPRKQIAINGQKVSYLEAGHGMPVILIHAFPLNAEMWEPQLASPPPGWRMIAPDLRGFHPQARGLERGKRPERGRRPNSKDRLADSLDEYAADVLALMDGLGIDRAIVGGLSMGGYVTFSVLRRATDRVTGLILADTRSGPDTAAGRAGRRKMQALVDREGPGAVADEMVPKLLSDGTRRDRPALVRRIRELIESSDASAIRTALALMMERPDSGALLSSVVAPTLILVGAEDRLTPVAEAERMRRFVRGAGLVVIPGAAHLSNMERPDEFNAALRRFAGAHG